jgi:hypothetical protein
LRNALFIFLKKVIVIDLIVNKTKYHYGNSLRDEAAYWGG